jgi:hemoglobin-like flavoprotein
MTEEQKQLVRATFTQAERISDIIGLIFYQRLFELDPSLRPLFRNDIQEQSRKLMATLKLAVDALDQPGHMVGAIQALGRRHIQYGVNENHYETVTSALVWTFEHALGSDFPVSARLAWFEVFEWLTSIMKDAATEARRNFDTSRFMQPPPKQPA